MNLFGFWVFLCRNIAIHPAKKQNKTKQINQNQAYKIDQHFKTSLEKM